MFDFTSKDIRKFKILGLLAFLILFIILLVFGIRFYFSRAIMEDWTNIAEEKKKEIHVECLNLFYNYQNRTSQFSYQLSRNKRLVNAVTSRVSKKSYEALYEYEAINDFNVEIYNSRLELFLFSGRQVYPDITELKRSMDGERYSKVKEAGIYTYIIVFEPLKSESGSIEGVIVTSKLLDVNPDVQARFFNRPGIKKEIFDKFHIDVLFEFGDETLAGIAYDTTSGEVSRLNLKSINDETTGRIIIPNLDQSSYLLSVINKFDNITGFLLFILSLIMVYGVITASSRAKSYFLRITFAGISLLLARYLWLGLNFPENFVIELGSDIFSPVHYASGLGFGMAKSLGELFVSSIVMLCIAVFGSLNIVKFYKSESVKKHKKFTGILFITGALVVILSSINVFGTINHTLIFDSTIKFIDKSDIFSLNQPELVTVRLIILCLAASLILIILSSSLIIVKFLNTFLTSSKTARKNSVIIVFTALLIMNVLMNFIPIRIYEFPLTLNLRLLIIAISGLFTYYIHRQMQYTKNFRLITLVNFSLVLLACAIFVPSVLLNKITSLENKYLEKAAKEVSQQSSDKISFLISSTLEDISDDVTVEKDLKNKNKFSKLAFNIWARSKFYDEDLNSAVIILDTAKRLISDFNINPDELISDSVITFTLRSQDIKAGEQSGETDEEPETLDMNLVMNSMVITEAADVLQNTEMKFYSAMMPLEKPDLRHSRFKSILGYIIIAAGYDAKNFLTQTNLGIFKNFTRDNILNKLTSTPVISEFSESELVGSSNKDISKSLVKSLDAFRESVKDKIDKSALRYDDFENQLYKSYYVLTENKTGNSAASEKIYVVSVKVNDFSLSTFFFFRYLLFIVLIYLICLVVYIVFKAFSYLLDTESVRFIKFGFREKLFASFLLASVIPIVILAIYTREFVNDKNEKFYKNQLISDLRIVEQYVKNKTSTEAINQDKLLKKENPDNFTKLFDKGFSESDKNFNFYQKTKLAATTSEQLYKSDLLDTRISGNAFYNIALLKKDYFSENQQIGDYTFIVGYKPLYDSFNDLTGIISTQTVFKQSEINQELTESLVYILGPYFAAVIVLIFIVNFLSYRISNPVLKLQKATEQLSRGNIDIHVKSNSKDEIGELVNSFNRMIKELRRSRVELKKAEREGAWRDIARQVAHEIKNPLTPMKLAMQHLYYAYTHGSNDFKTIIQTTNKMIIEQVETLNRIATEFSNFAKLPSRNYENLNMNDILVDVVKLMNTNGKINLKIDESLKRSRVMGDKDEVKRALINIIKNAMQAIDEKDNVNEGNIIVESIKNNGLYSVKIKDNGIGMDDDTKNKLFEPYFSTKSSGMGLGLVITKKVLDDMKAKITVHSSKLTGTEVEILFKLVHT